MNPDRLDPRRFVSFDCETWAVYPGSKAPPPVCASVAVLEGSEIRGRLLDKEAARKVFRRLLEDDTRTIVGANIPFDMLVFAVDAARNGEDLVPAIFEVYRQGRVFDIQVAEALHAIAEGTLGFYPNGQQLRNDEGKATGRYSLHACVDLVLGRTNAKANDEWRKRYHELDGIPIAEWPATARVYPVDDACNTLEVAVAQVVGRKHLEPPHGLGGVHPNRNLAALAEQCYKAWSLHLAAAWGLRTDPVATEELAAAVEVGRAKWRPIIQGLGFIREDGSEDQAKVKKAVALAYGAHEPCPRCAGTGKVYNKFSKRDPSVPVGKPVQCVACNGSSYVLEGTVVPMTTPTEKMVEAAEAAGVKPVGNVQIGRDKLIESGDEDLAHYAEFQEDDKIADTYIPKLREGYDRPIVLSPNAVLETLRVSYDGVWQLLPRQVSARLAEILRERGASVVGVRDCIVPRPGKVFYSVDFKGGELVTFAESAVARVGFSKMGEVLNAGADVHSIVAAKMVGMSDEEFARRKKEKRCKDLRQAAKPIDFGTPGSMGAVRIVLNQREQGPDTPCKNGPSLIWDPGTKSFVRGYKGLRFCVLVGGRDRCGEVKVTKWGKEGYERDYPPTCRACIECAVDLRNLVFRVFPEIPLYLRWHADNANELGWVSHYYTGFVRGGIDYGSGANGDFQMSLALIAGRAQCRVSYEQYCVPSSPLYGSRSILFAHDELFGECGADVGHEVAMRVHDIMVEEFRRGCPRHAAACAAEPALMTRWYKAAEPVWNDGRLVPWSPN